MTMAVLITSFNRPDLLEICISELLKDGHRLRFYVHIDGPRVGNEVDRENTKKCQEIAKQLLTSSFTKIKVQDVNLGCWKGMEYAITWFLEQEEGGLVVEDDVLVSRKGIRIAELALNQFREDKRIGAVSLYNPIGVSSSNTDFKFLTCYVPQLWGWVTWRDRWNRQLDVPSRWSFGFWNFLPVIVFMGFRNFRFWRNKFSAFQRKSSDTWDIPFIYRCWRNNLRTLVAEGNLVTNIGFDSRATHTKASHKRKGINYVAAKYTADELRDQALVTSGYLKSCFFERKLHSRVYLIPSLLFGTRHFSERLWLKINSVLKKYVRSLFN